MSESLANGECPCSRADPPIWSAAARPIPKVWGALVLRVEGVAVLADTDEGSKDFNNHPGRTG
eukprot:2307704-Pyramimonas_sp.AAC.1